MDLLPRRVAVCPLMAVRATGVEVVNAGPAVHVDVPFQVSVALSVSDPVEEPPTRSTEAPPVASDEGMSVAVCPTRFDVIVPTAVFHLPSENWVVPIELLNNAESPIATKLLRSVFILNASMPKATLL